MSLSLCHSLSLLSLLPNMSITHHHHSSCFHYFPNSKDTGCGKTTQVPQLVLDDLIYQNRGAETNIICTQPRRISAIGVAERIAQERCERIGETSGYSIRLESKRSKSTRILFCTTGVLLRRLQCDPDLAAVSHVFVDEVHERDLNTDFVLIILKDLLLRRKALKLVLMR